MPYAYRKSYICPDLGKSKSSLILHSGDSDYSKPGIFRPFKVYRVSVSISAPNGSIYICSFFFVFERVHKLLPRICPQFFFAAPSERNNNKKQQEVAVGGATPSAPLTVIVALHIFGSWQITYTTRAVLKIVCIASAKTAAAAGVGAIAVAVASASAVAVEFCHLNPTLNTHFAPLCSTVPVIWCAAFCAQFW